MVCYFSLQHYHSCCFHILIAVVQDVASFVTTIALNSTEAMETHFPLYKVPPPSSHSPLASLAPARRVVLSCDSGQSVTSILSNIIS